MKPVSCGIAIRSWLSSISRSSVVPEPCEPTMKIGPPVRAGFRWEVATARECRVPRRGPGDHAARAPALPPVQDGGGGAKAEDTQLRARVDADPAHRADGGDLRRGQRDSPWPDPGRRARARLDRDPRAAPGAPAPPPPLHPPR